MPAEPAVKRALAFIDGQNLFRCAKATFGYTFPNYDVQASHQFNDYENHIRLAESEAFL